MAQGYYTLQEAASVLGMSPDKLKQMAQKNQIRSFQDRGTWRFRIKDIEELARSRAGTSDPDLVLGEAPPKSGAAPRSGIKSKSGIGGPKTPRKEESQDDSVFDFELSTGDDLEVPPASPPRRSPSGHGAKPPSKATPKSGVRKSENRPAMLPEGSDSDVKLVADGSDFDLTYQPKSKVDSPRPVKAPSSGGIRNPSSGAVKLPSSGSVKSPGSGVVRGGTPSSGHRRSGTTPKPTDSGARLVPMDSDSDVKIVGSNEEVPLGEMPDVTQADSNVRLEKVKPPSRGEEERMSMTEEINLDEEIAKAEAKKAQQRASRVKPKSELKMSPFELSDSDVGHQPATPVQAKKKPTEDSSDFDLAVPKDGSSDFDISPESSSPTSEESDFSLELDDDALGGDSQKMSGPSSGINLSKPLDHGISLEGDDSSVDFDLSLEPGATPRPELQAQGETGDSSEFDLSLDLPEADSSTEDASSSEFELSLDSSGEMAADSSEFELSLDDAEAQKPQAKKPAGKKKKPSSAGGEEGDIFETDFEVPSLEEDDSSVTAGIDTDLESSDFDLALDDSEIAADEESGSQVVALDEDEASEVVADDEIQEVESEFGNIDGEEEEAAAEEDDAIRPLASAQPMEPAPWGVLPVLFMLPSLIVMLLVGLLGLEMVNSSVGSRPPGTLTRALGDQFGINSFK